MAAKPMYEIGATQSSEINTDVELNVSVGEKTFRIELYTSKFEGSPKLLEQYLRHVERSDPTYIPPPLQDDEEGDFLDPLEEFYDWATQPFASLFRNVPPLVRNREYTMQDCLFPELLVYTLEVVDDTLVPVQRDFDREDRFVGALLPASKPLHMFALPIYRPHDVHVPLDDDAVALPVYPNKVYIRGQHPCFFKQILPGEVGMIVTELTTYAKISGAGFGEDVRISRLMGVVEDEHTSRIVGLLLSYIDCRNKTLTCAVRSSERALREKWLKQITYSLEQLHARNIVWGDAKPDNVLIDIHNDAYLVDFGGSYTPGWVDKEFINTQQGDLQGLQRIKDWFAKFARR